MHDDDIKYKYLTERKSPYQIAIELGKSPKTIYNKLQKLGIQEKRNGEISSGDKFELLETVEIVGKNRYGYIWLCKCKCGNTTKCTTARLKSNGVKSCGCLKKRSGSQHHNWSGYKDITGHWWSNRRASARHRGLAFKLNIKKAWYLLESQQFKCYLSGLPISINDDTASIDRRDPLMGYTSSNVAWCHKHINRIKWTMNIDEFLSLCEDISRYTSCEIGSIHNGVICSSYLKDMEHNANKRNLPYNISATDIVALYNRQGGKCAISGRPIVLPQTNREYRLRCHTASLDRIDSSLAYTESNIWMVHKLINQSKSDFDYQYYINLCNLVWRYYG